jgi:hypothetical protein
MGHYLVVAALLLPARHPYPLGVVSRTGFIDEGASDRLFDVHIHT